MPKIIMEFDLPEEREDFDMANNGAKYYSFICDIQQQARSWDKYGHPFKTASEACEAFRGLAYDIDLD